MDGDLAMATTAFTNRKQQVIQKAHLYIGKTVVEHIYGCMVYKLNTEYSFALEFSEDGGNTWQPAVLTGDVFRSDGGRITDGANGKFTLKTLDTAYISVDTGKLYRAIEEDPGLNFYSMYALVQTDVEGFTAAYAIDSGVENAVLNGRETEVLLITENTSVTFMTCTHEKIGDYADGTL